MITNKVLFAALLLISAGVSLCGQSLEDRLQDHYVGKFVEVKIFLPAEMAPLIVYPQKEEKFDVRLYKLKIEKMGVGLEPGAIALIKKVKASSKEITFDLIGVGFELPLGGLPMDLIDEKIWQAGGGRIRLIFNEPLELDDSTIGRINKWLSTMITTRTLVTGDDLPPEMHTAVRNGVILAGMNHKAVFLALGEPMEILRELRQGGLDEAWLYEREDFITLMVIFRDGLVTIIKEF